MGGSERIEDYKNMVIWDEKFLGGRAVGIQLLCQYKKGGKVVYAICKSDDMHHSTACTHIKRHKRIVVFL